MTEDPVVAELRRRAEALEGCDPARFREAWSATWGWVNSPEVAPRLRRALNDARDEGIAGALARHQLAALLHEEEEETEAVLARPTPHGGNARDAITSPFGRATYDRLAEAARLVDLRACRRAAVVGGGPFPAAALFLRDTTPIQRIDVYDVVPGAVERSVRWAAWCGDGRLRPRLADGTTVDYAGVDLAYVVNHARPKAAILARVRDTAPVHVRILLREPVDLGRLTAETGLSSGVAGLRVLAEGEADPRFHSRHVLLGRA